MNKVEAGIGMLRIGMLNMKRQNFFLPELFFSYTIEGVYKICGDLFSHTFDDHLTFWRRSEVAVTGLTRNQFTGI